MKLFLTLLLAAHGALHLLGVAKALAPGAVPQLKAPIGLGAGVLWFAACAAFWAAAIVLHTAPRQFWLVTLAALAASQTAIGLSWADAKFGTLPNLLLFLPVAVSLLDLRPGSFPSAYRRAVESQLSSEGSTSLVTEADLSPLPPVVQTYLRRAGVVGQPRVKNFRAHFRGEMRNGKNAPWMKIVADQVDFVDTRARVFLVHAWMKGIPFDALHLYSDATATMQVRVASLFDVVDARGPLMNQSETVTLFNDLCLFAPGSLVDAPVVWSEVTPRSVRATFVNLDVSISADLFFDDAGDLEGFLSNDRYQSADGKAYSRLPWWTPVGTYRRFGAVRLPAKDEAAWREADGEFTYARFELESIEYNVTASPRAPRGELLASNTANAASFAR